MGSMESWPLDQKESPRVTFEIRTTQDEQEIRVNHDRKAIRLYKKKKKPVFYLLESEQKSKT